MGSYVTIAATGICCPAPAYLEGLRRAKAAPEATFKTSLKGWWPATGAEIVAQYRGDLHHRINARGGIRIRDSRVPLAQWGIASTPRVVLDPSTVRTFNRHQKPRLAHRERDPMEF